MLESIHFPGTHRSQTEMERLTEHSNKPQNEGSGTSGVDSYMPSPTKAKLVCSTSKFIISSNEQVFFRYDWYQTDSEVVLTILLKDTKQEDIKVNFCEDSVKQ